MDGGVSDKKQIGLTNSGDGALAKLSELELFATPMDAYRFAIAYAIAAELPLSSAPDGGYNTKYNASGGVDFDGSIRDILLELRIGDSNRPYATAERLAEIGLRDLSQRVTAHESLDEILRSTVGLAHRDAE